MAFTKEINKYNIVPFSGDGFSTWAFRLKSILRENECMQAIENENFMTDASTSQNGKIENKAQAIIVAAVADSHIEYVRQPSAYLMFKNLERNFKERGTRSKLFLRRNLSDMKYKESTPLKEHFVKIINICTQLEEADSKLTEEEKINYILLSMPKSYEPIVIALETIGDLSLNIVMDRLLAEEEKRKKGHVEFEQPNAFNCYTCGKPGHKKYQCRQGVGSFRGHGNYQNSGRGYRGGGQGNYQGQGGYQGRGQGYQGRGQGYQGRGQGGYQGRGRAGYQGSQQGQSSNGNRGTYGGSANYGNAFLSGQEQEIVSQDTELEFYVDSGCSDHLINSKDNFIDYLELKTPRKISAAKNGVILEAVGIGNIEVVSKVGSREHICLIKNVYYVPDLRKNLLSVSKMESAGLTIVFDHGKVRIYNHSLLIMIGNNSGTLYSLNLKVNVNSCNFLNQTNKDDCELWHRRFGHLGMANVNLLIQRDMVKGLSLLKNKTNENELCEPCLLGKSTRQPFNKTGYRAKRPLELIHTDVCGPISPCTWDGNNYYVTFIDDFTHFTMVYLIKHKSEVFSKFQHYYFLATNHFNLNVLKLRMDNGREYVTNEFRDFCSSKGIIMQHTVPYNPEMNGVAERMNRTLMDKARTMLIDSGMKKEFWGEAVLFSAYVTNRSPVAGREKTPSEMWEGRKPDVSNLRVFGSIAYNHVPKETRKKLDNKGKKMIMIGYSIGGYKLYDEETNSIVIGRNVIFDEKKNVGKLNTHVYLPDYDNDNGEEENLGKETDTRQRTEKETSREQGNKDNRNEEKEEEFQEIIEDTQEKERENKRKEGKQEIIKGDVRKEERSETGREKRQISKPKWQNDYELDLDDEYEDALYALFGAQDDVPIIYSDIEQREDKEDWKRAVKEEIKVLEESETFEIVPTPTDKKILDGKWVFTRKEMEKGKLCKARLVIRGFQQEGIIEEVYSPVLKMQTLRTLLSVAAYRDYHIHQMDVKGAFLYGRIDEEVYLQPPEGLDIKPGHVLKLKKSLYGLKKSPKYWYEKFHETITSYGFQRSNNDYCLYSKGDMYLLLYVDDLLILGSNTKDIEWVKLFLKTNFKMKDMGQDNLMYLGISIKRTSEGYTLDQSKYLMNVLEKFNMQECKGCDTPMDANFKIDSSDVDMSYEKQCRSLIGSLMYATVGTRPDLAAAVYYLGRFQSKPNIDLWRALKRLLRYVKKTVNYALFYTKDMNSKPLIGYADADWARDGERKSTSGYLLKVFNNTVVWKSRKQSTVALSTTEAEFVALCESIMEACWMIKLLNDLKIDVENVTIFEDNQSTIKSIINPDQKRLKHIDVKYNYIKQKVEENVINIRYLNTKEQIADILTKPLCKSLFNNLVKKLDLCVMDVCVEEGC